MGSCYQKFYRCGECCCWDCCVCGMFKHMAVEWNLTCGDVSGCCRFSSNVIVQGIILASKVIWIAY